MSIRRQDGAKADLGDSRLDDLSAVEQIYLSRHPKSLKDLMFLKLKAYKNVTNTLLARSFGMHKTSTGRACKRAQSRLEKIAQEFFSEVARGPIKPDEN